MNYFKSHNLYVWTSEIFHWILIYFFTIYSYVGCFNRWLNNNDNQVDLQIGTKIDSCWNVDIIIN